METIEITINKEEGFLDITENHATFIFNDKTDFLEQLSEILSDKDIKEVIDYKKEIGNES